MTLGMQVVSRTIPASGAFFHNDLVMANISTAILPLPLIQEEHRKNVAKYW